MRNSSSTFNALILMSTLIGFGMFAQTNSPPIPDPHLDPTVIDTISGKYGLFSAILMIIGLSRSVFKPITDLFRKARTGNVFQDADVQDAGNGYKLLHFLVDYFTSVKLSTFSTPKPADKNVPPSVPPAAVSILLVTLFSLFFVGCAIKKTVVTKNTDGTLTTNVITGSVERQIYDVVSAFRREAKELAGAYARGYLLRKQELEDAKDTNAVTELIAQKDAVKAAYDSAQQYYELTVRAYIAAKGLAQDATPTDEQLIAFESNLANIFANLKTILVKVPKPTSKPSARLGRPILDMWAMAETANMPPHTRP
jgi:hypothetical protein